MYVTSVCIFPTQGELGGRKGLVPTNFTEPLQQDPKEVEEAWSSPASVAPATALPVTTVNITPVQVCGPHPPFPSLRCGRPT